MVKKRKDNGELTGFQDFMQDGPSHQKGPIKSPDKGDEGKALSFLENNFQRLNKTTELMTKQLPLLAQYDQSQQILSKYQQEQKELRERIINKLSDKNSPFNLCLNSIFISHFKNIKESN